MIMKLKVVVVNWDDVPDEVGIVIGSLDTVGKGWKKVFFPGRKLFNLRIYPVHETRFIHKELTALKIECVDGHWQQIDFNF